MTTTGPENLVHVGPFFDEKKLSVWLQEMAMRLSPAALALLPKPKQRPPAGDASALPRSRRRMVVEVLGVEHWEGGPTLAVRTGKVLSAS